MKILALLILFLSIFLDGTIPLFTNYYLLSNLTYITLILIYPLFLQNKKLYITFLILSSSLYDILYTNILFFHTVIFICIFLILDKHYQKINFSFILKYYLLYELLLFSLLYTINYTKDIFYFLKLITSSIIINTIYSSFLYLLFKDKYKQRKINYNQE